MFKKLVADLKPGEQIDIDEGEMDLDRTIRPPFRHNGAFWTLADNVLEGIVGSAYEYGYFRRPQDRVVTFFRLKEPLTDGSLSYVSPDRRQHFSYDGAIYRRTP